MRVTDFRFQISDIRYLISDIVLSPFVPPHDNSVIFDSSPLHPSPVSYFRCKISGFMEKNETEPNEISFGSKRALIGILGLVVAAVALLLIIRVCFL